MILFRDFSVILSCFVLLGLAGCQTVPQPEEFFHPVSLADRQMQTRIYPTDDEIDILKTCAELLLDNEFQVKEAESRLGWVDASKFKVVQNLNFYAFINVSVVTLPVQGRSGAIAVRVIFYRGIPGQGISMIKELAIYQEFFTKLSKALFLEAQPI